ncbi:MAG TPA: hypothetical protein VE871_13395 [Longimicrobium sp.]|nr:hypothetical protein [Longimicrobium sp.]
MRILPLAIVFAAACGDDAADAPRPPAAEPVTSPAAAAAADSGGAAAPASTAADSGPGLAVVVNRQAERSYAMWGRTDAQALELSVEDGHNVLYGPARIQIRGGAFSTELALEPTDRPTVFAYVTEPGGTRQWVVPIPLGSTRVAWGAGAAELPDTPPPVD